MMRTPIRLVALLVTGLIGGGCSTSTGPQSVPAKWTRIAAGLPGGVADHRCFAVSLNTVWVGTSGDGVFRSADGGVTWTQSAGQPASRNIQALLVSGSTLLAGGNAGVFRSTDGGATWKPATTQPASSQIGSPRLRSRS